MPGNAKNRMRYTRQTSAKPLVQNASVTAVPDTKKEIADGELDEWFSETETENNIKLKE